jgi:hypothetical protein
MPLRCCETGKARRPSSRRETRTRRPMPDGVIPACNDQIDAPGAATGNRDRSRRRRTRTPREPVPRRASHVEQRSPSRGRSRALAAERQNWLPCSSGRPRERDHARGRSHDDADSPMTPGRLPGVELQGEQAGGPLGNDRAGSSSDSDPGRSGSTNPGLANPASRSEPSRMADRAGSPTARRRSFSSLPSADLQLPRRDGFQRDLVR